MNDAKTIMLSSSIITIDATKLAVCISRANEMGLTARDTTKDRLSVAKTIHVEGDRGTIRRFEEWLRTSQMIDAQDLLPPTG